MRQVVIALACVGSLLGCVAGSSGAAGANLIQNGSFEQGVLADPNGMTLAAGSTVIDHWLVGGHGIDWIGAYWQAADGGRSIDLDSGMVLGQGPYDGTLSQAFATTPGQQYLVSFWMAGNPDGGLSVKPLQVTAAGTSVEFGFDNTLGQTTAAMGYVPREFSFFANSDTTTLSFISLTGGVGQGFGPVLDNVAVTLVPEPSSLVLLLLAAGSMAVACRMKTRKVPGTC
jgi:choice-of-anchor C domain-containing protein